MSVHREIGAVTVILAGALADVVTVDVSGIDALIFDIENVGSSPVTAWALLARISKQAPFRSVTPASVKGADGAMVIRAAAAEVATLPAGDFSQFAINVSLFESVKLRASGSGAVLKVNAGGLA